MTKVGGFLCDAYYAEWTYGKLQVVKKAMASAFARLIESGYYEEEDVPRSSARSSTTPRATSKTSARIEVVALPRHPRVGLKSVRPAGIIIPRSRRPPC
jgi:hypothetical protein